MKGKRLTECPHCGSKAYTAVEPPYAYNRRFWCRSCGKGFRYYDARRKAAGWTESEIRTGINRRLLKELME